MQDAYNKGVIDINCVDIIHNGHCNTVLFSSKRNSCFGENSRLLVSNRLHNFWCPEHNVTSFGKYACVYLSVNFVESVNKS